MKSDKMIYIFPEEAGSGDPCDRLMAEYLLAILVILRITESVKTAVLFASSFMFSPFLRSMVQIQYVYYSRKAIS